MTRKILHIAVAVLILISSTGFTIHMHFCHDQLIDMAFLTPADSCCDTEVDGPNQSQDSCPGCQEESIVVEPGDDYEVITNTVKFENSHNIKLFLTSVILNNYQVSDEAANHEVPWYKKPPPYQKVVLSQIQSYLI